MFSGCCATWPGMTRWREPCALINRGQIRQEPALSRCSSEASGKDLKWFFEDWVYHDRGLPDLSIAGVYPNKASVPGSYIVSVDVANSGTAEAEVPVSVSSATTTVTERLRIPAKSRVSHRFLLQGQPAEVAVNDGTVPEVEASVHRQTAVQ